IAIRPGISPSARRSSLRPHSARPRSATLYGTRPAALAASYACIFSLRTVDMLLSSTGPPEGGHYDLAFRLKPEATNGLLPPQITRAPLRRDQPAAIASGHR